MKQKIFCLFTMLLLLYPTITSAGVKKRVRFVSDDICYELLPLRNFAYVSREITEDSFMVYSGDIVIPEVVTYDGEEYPVEAIASHAFENCTELTSVTFPQNIRLVGLDAFDGCTNLTTVNFPETLIKKGSIGSRAFNGCCSLTTINISYGFQKIESKAFANCTKLKSIQLPSDLTSIEESVFYGCTELESITIPASVTSIEQKVFAKCTNLKTLVIEKENPKYDSRDNSNAIIETASNKLIAACPSTIIPQNIVAIGNYAFHEITFTNQTLPESLKNIESYAFYKCDLGSTLIVPGATHLDQTALFICDVDTIILSGPITTLESSTFVGLPKLTLVDLPSSLKYIGDDPFSDGGYMSLQKIICRAPNPPKCTYNSFRYLGNNLTLEVPEESVLLYKNADIWENFYCIKSENSEGIVDLPDSNRNIVKKGLGTYYTNEEGECTYLYSYNYTTGDEEKDSTVFTKWNTRDVIVIDVDTIGPNAFSKCTFRSGQIIYFTDKVKTILEDAFSYINIRGMWSVGPDIATDLTLVFEGETPPNIAQNNIMHYDDHTFYIKFSVPDIPTYIESDIQWTYAPMIEKDELIYHLNRKESIITYNPPTITAKDSTEMEIGTPTGNNENDSISLTVNARPRRDIPVRVGDGENKDIYSRAPAWMSYTIELKITDSKERILYTESKQCYAYEECQFDASFMLPSDGIVYVHSRSINRYGDTSDWTTEALNLDTNIDTVVAPDYKSTPYYDMQGRKVVHPTRGVYIKDGKKVYMN